jgi:hypothetical protein
MQLSHGARRTGHRHNLRQSAACWGVGTRTAGNSAGIAEQAKMCSAPSSGVARYSMPAQRVIVVSREVRRDRRLRARPYDHLA